MVILVDKHDKEIGTAEKLDAHRRGLLHRAFSILIFDSVGQERLLIHQRALDKYHSGGLWTNACCSHPRPGESIEQAAHRRLKEEMGFDCSLKTMFSFIYKKEFDNGFTEHEFDHVFSGVYNGVILPNPDEVAAYKWVTWDDLKSSIKQDPELYTVWFCKIIKLWEEKFMG